MFESLREYFSSPQEIRALSLLRDPSLYPAMPSMADTACVLQTFTVPSFTPILSWTVYCIRSERFVVRRVRWDFALDRRAQIGDPSTYAADAQLDPAFVQSQLQALAAISMSPFDMPQSIGLDGVSFGVRREFGCRSCEYSWWCQPPESCQPIADWYHQFTESVEALLPAHTDSFDIQPGTHDQITADTGSTKGEQSAAGQPPGLLCRPCTPYP
jgi:hypothetical protein